MGVDVTHLVFEANGDTLDKVVDDSADGTEDSDTLAGAVVQLDRDGVLFGTAERDRKVGEILYELACSEWEKKRISRDPTETFCGRNGYYFCVCLSAW